MNLQPCSLNGISFDALVSETKSYSSEVPEYAVETGFTVSDHISVKPVTLEATVYLTRTPVTWLSKHGTGEGRVEAVVSTLEQLYFSRQLVTFRTSTDSYERMAITGLTVPKDSASKRDREIRISLKQVNTVSSQSTSIPPSYARGGSSGASAGTASTGAGSGGNGKGSTSSGKKESEGKASILYNLVGGKK